MASIRKRNSSYQVQIRLNGHPTLTKTFSTLENAKTWARKTEAETEANGIIPRLEKGLTIGVLLKRYLETITPRKRGKAQEARRIMRLMRDPISRQLVSSATPSVFAAFRERRLNDGLRACSYDLVILSHMFKVAKYEWGLPIQENPLHFVKKPPALQARERRISAEEWQALERAAEKCLNKLIWPLVVFAVETAMRRGEILSLRWQDVNLETQTATLRETKNGSPRTIPLSKRAVAILRTCPIMEGQPFPLTEYSTHQAWTRLVRRAGVSNLRFHDLRHEGISALVEKGLSIPEVALISGHKDIRQLFRYTHLRPEDLAKKIG